MTERKKARTFRVGLRGQLFLLILVAGALCLGLFRFLWLNKWDMWEFWTTQIPSQLQPFPLPDDDLWIKLGDAARQCDIPDSEDDLEAVDALEPFFNVVDDYTSIYIYGQDGLFRAGAYANRMNDTGFAGFFHTAYEWTDGTPEQRFDVSMEFRNGWAQVLVSFYHSAGFMLPYLIFCILISVLCFVLTILIFMGRKMKTVKNLERDILRMAAGDLETPVSGGGRDELGVLSQELDQLRTVLHDNFVREQEMHRSNRELIAALSHDLRTPLTILNGYLEIVQQNRNPELQSEYLARCRQKAADIREMTDRMFEYALVYDESEPVTLTDIPLGELLAVLREHTDFLRLSGFETVQDLPGEDGSPSGSLPGDRTLLGRICSNLFSNVLKYGDKQKPVTLTVTAEDDIQITLQNAVRPVSDGVESNKIGLKSVKKMLALMGGTLTADTEDEVFTVRLRIPVGGKH